MRFSRVIRRCAWPVKSSGSEAQAGCFVAVYLYLRFYDNPEIGVVTLQSKSTDRIIACMGVPLMFSVLSQALLATVPQAWLRITSDQSLAAWKGRPTSVISSALRNPKYTRITGIPNEAIFQLSRAAGQTGVGPGQFSSHDWERKRLKS